MRKMRVSKKLECGWTRTNEAAAAVLVAAVPAMAADDVVAAEARGSVGCDRADQQAANPTE
jgi:hypothetical protein